MNACIAALNIGSSSIKLAFYDAEAVDNAPPAMTARLSGLDGPRPALRWNGEAPAGAAPDSLDGALDSLLAEAGRRLGGASVRAAGHRIVHGGADFAAPAVLDAAALARLEALVPLAPQHQGANLAGVRAAARAWPDAEQVGCFDTAFHRTQPREAELFALPRAFADEGVVRYGFHGLSYEHLAAAAPRVLAGRAGRRIAAAHLGAGASMCAMLNGRSVATTMGFTALDGLPMATRSGAVDPGLLLYLLEQRGMTPAELRELLYERSGLLGLSGISGDMQTLLQSEDPAAGLALDVYCYRARREIGSLAAALGGLDALIFTGGVGENAAPVRARICQGLEFLGLRLDPAANAAGGPEIGAPDTAASIWVIPTDEERIIAAAARKGAARAVAI